MVLSLSHQFIFVHVYKTGGTSIAAALEEYSHDSSKLLLGRVLRRTQYSRKVPIVRYKNVDRLKHARARVIADEFPSRVWNKYFKFAFVRNPWDWHVSIYHYILNKPDHSMHSLFAGMNGFSKFIEWKISHHKRLQKDFLSDDRGNIIVDYIGKMESIEEDFGNICSILNIDAKLPHLNKSAHRPFRQYYCDYTRRLVEEHFREDIELFGYSFDEAA